MIPGKFKVVFGSVLNYNQLKMMTMGSTTSTKDFHFTEKSQTRGQADEGALNGMPSFECK